MREMKLRLGSGEMGLGAFPEIAPHPEINFLH
jgi:hypothetical protein